MPLLVLRGITHRFQWLSPSTGHVAHALLTLSPVAARVLLPRDAPRLACVKPAASVHPEPGSNSSLYIFKLHSKLVLDFVSLRNWRSFKFKKSVTLFRYLLVLSYQSFQWTFNKPGLSALGVKNPLVTERDCKGTTFFQTGKFFSDFFWTFFTTAP